MDDIQAMNWYLRTLEDHSLNERMRINYENDFRAILERQEGKVKREFQERFQTYEFLMKEDRPASSYERSEVI